MSPGQLTVLWAGILFACATLVNVQRQLRAIEKKIDNLWSELLKH